MSGNLTATSFRSPTTHKINLTLPTDSIASQAKNLYIEFYGLKNSFYLTPSCKFLNSSGYNLVTSCQFHSFRLLEMQLQPDTSNLASAQNYTIILSNMGYLNYKVFEFLSNVNESSLLTYLPFNYKVYLAAIDSNDKQIITHLGASYSEKANVEYPVDNQQTPDVFWDYVPSSGQTYEVNSLFSGGRENIFRYLCRYVCVLN